MEERNTNQDANPADGTGEKTFTQDDVNRIVQERLAKERAKGGGDADFEKRERELAARELRVAAKEMLAAKGLPERALDALNCADRETMEKSVATLESIFNEHGAGAAKRTTFRGFQPGNGLGVTEALGAAGDPGIRKAMGLCP